jgi:hypothetical protein
MYSCSRIYCQNLLLEKSVRASRVDKLSGREIYMHLRGICVEPRLVSPAPTDPSVLFHISYRQILEQLSY